MDHDAAPPAVGDDRRTVVLARLERHLRQLRERHGNPSFATMARRIVHEPGVAGSKNVFNGLVKNLSAVPREDVLRGFAQALGASAEETAHLIELRRAAVAELFAIPEKGGPSDDVHDRDTGEPVEDSANRDEGEPHDPAVDWRRRWLLVLIVLDVVGVLIATAALVLVLTSASTRLEGRLAGPVITGAVTCRSGANVVGVYIAATGITDEQGFASWDPGPEPGTASYVFTLPQPLIYSVHVGCGGTRQDWAVESRSSGHFGTTGSFFCFDDEALDRRQKYGRCETR